MSGILHTAARAGLRSAARGFFLLSGCGTLANTRPFSWAANEEAITPARLRDGSILYVHMNDYVGRAAYFFGDLDPKLSWICRSVLRPGDLMIDVGGNYGLITMLAAGLVGPSGEVHVFEPQEDLVSMIHDSCAANGYQNVRVHPYGLSDADAEVRMTIPPTNRGMATVARELRGHHTTVVLKQADRYLDHALGARRPRLVKIDVEGHEAQVLSGASSWLARVQPEVLVFEHNSDSALWDMPGIDTLCDHGYRFFGVPKVKLRMRVEPLVHGQATRPRFHDIVAVHPQSDWAPPVRG